MGGVYLQAEGGRVAEGGRGVRLQLSPRKQVEFRRSYRALLAQGMTASAAAKTLGVYTERIRHDLFAHPLDEPLPDIDNLVTASELAAAVGISYQQLQKRLARCRVSPEMRYARIFWYRRDAVERLKDGTERYEAIPLDRLGEVKTLATNFTTRKIYLFEQGAPIERVSDPCDKCVSPEQAEAECRIWRKRLDPEHYARLEQLLRFRVATWRARVKRNREGFEPSAAGDSAIAERVIRLKASRKLNPDPLRGVRTMEGDE